jgi:chemotaxis protein CheZ
MISLAEEDRLKRELLGLFGHMSKMRRELATLHGENTKNFASMADTLDAIIESTEQASNTILESMEDIEAIAGELRTNTDAAAAPQLCDRIVDRVNQVFEACSFQDLTGQRVTRVVNALKFVEDRVNTMIRMWGKDELAEVFEELKRESELPKEDDPDKALLHGPQRANVAMPQNDIDKLFNQDDIDKLFG